MPATRQWQFESGAWQRTICWTGDTLDITDAREDQPSSTEQRPWTILLNGETIGSIDVEAEILKIACQGPPPHALSASLRRRWNFWRHLQPDRAPIMAFSVVSPRVQNWKVRAWTTPSGMCHQLYDETQHPMGRVETKRWDWVFSHGPTIGNLSLSDRRKLRAQLLAALDHSPQATDLPPRAPLLDYASLPTTVWEGGDTRNGHRACCEDGWMTWMGWSYPPPEGGTLHKPIEGILTGGFPDFVLLAHESEDAIRTATQEDAP